MEVITIQHEAFQQIVSEIQKLRQAFHERPSDETFDINETCKLLKCSPRTLQTWRDKKLISYIQVGNKIMFRRSDIDTFLNKHKVRCYY